MLTPIEFGDDRTRAARATIRANDGSTDLLPLGLTPFRAFRGGSASCAAGGSRSMGCRWSAADVRPAAGSRVQRTTRAPPRFMTASTSASVAVDVSPGVVIASAPWAAPYSSASSGGQPWRRP